MNEGWSSPVTNPENLVKISSIEFEIIRLDVELLDHYENKKK